jgi:hypothetical protein
MKRKAEKADGNDDGELTVNSRVRVYPGTDREDRGIVVEDFGASAGQAVDVGKYHIADPARRWAVMLDGGNLVFVDSDQLVAD